eukprot:g12572.t1
MIIHLRPAEIWKEGSDAETVRFCLGSLGIWTEKKLTEVLLFKPAEIEEATICLYLDDRNAPPEVAFRARLVEKHALSDFVEKFGGKSHTDHGRKVYETEETPEKPATAYMIIDRKGREYASAPKYRAKDMVNAEVNPGLAFGGIDQLLKSSDNRRHLTILFDPADLRNSKKFLFPDTAFDLLGHFLVWFEDTKMDSVAWSFHFGDKTYDKFYSEILMRNKSAISSRVLQNDMNNKLESFAEVLLGAVERMTPKTVAQRKLVGRLPAMFQAYYVQTMQTSSGPSENWVRLATVLPKVAGPNLAAGSLFAWRLAEETDFTKPAPKRPSTKIPDLIADRLKLPVDVDFRRMPFQEAIAFIGEETHIRIEIDGDALKDSGYTKNMPQTMKLGSVEFDEARAVLGKEQFLLGHPDPAELYVEFAAVYLEFRYFSPWRLPWYFPSLPDQERIEAILTNDLDAARLFEQTRQGDLEHAYETEIEPGAHASPAEDVPADTDSEEEAEPTEPTTRQQARAEKLKLRAVRADERGNTVRAAILYRTAGAISESETALDRLVERLQAALKFSEHDSDDWRGTLSILLTRSTAGFWNTDRRLLYDLQKVCLDHERAVFKIDLVEAVRTWGKRPIKRPLPNQREVLMVKHLRSARARLNASSLSDAERQHLSHLLHTAVEAAERQMRAHLRPVVQASIEEVGFRPANLPEQVAAGKLVEEILDAVAHRGYVNMGILRDCISRNQIKLPDLAGPVELISGDRLLKADRLLAVELDGVYRRGEFYLRWLQRLSSVAFGTVIGRWITLFVLIPFGGAYVALSGIAHAVEKIGLHAHHFTQLPQVAAVGLFLLGVIHWPSFRKGAAEVFKWIVRFLGAILIDMPAWAIRNQAIRNFLRTRPVVFVRHFIATPGLLMAVFCYGLPALGLYGTASIYTAILVYMGFAIVLNTRFGRNFEELTTDWIDHTWYQLRTRFFVALFEFVMWIFHKLLELLERFLYAIDEWLRFRSGESRLMFWTKAVTGVFWAVVSFVVVFFITLLAEPQINPIKHFPVVTVSHKIILPLLPTISGALAGPLGETNGNFVAVAIVTLTPGIFGFLVWELRSNWRLYAANRPEFLHSVIVGSHGETMIRLMKPGFHSGTLPKLFARMRRSGRRNEDVRIHTVPAKYQETLHHIEESIRHFVDREFLGLLRESDCLNGKAISLSRVTSSLNNIRVEIRNTSSHDDPLIIVFQEQSGWLVAGIQSAGWVNALNETELRHFTTALAGLYKLSGTDFVREQIENGFEKPVTRYDIAGRRLIVWPDESFETELRYDLDSRPELRLVSRVAANEDRPARIRAADIIYTEQPVAWNDWVRYWDAVAEGETAVDLHRQDGQKPLAVVSPRPAIDPVG